MGMAILGDVLRNHASYEPDTIVYVADDSGKDPDLFTHVLLLRHGSDEGDTSGYRYLLETGVIGEVLEGLERLLGSPPAPLQSLRAVLYYAEHDAFPSLDLIR